VSLVVEDERKLAQISGGQRLQAEHYDVVCRAAPVDDGFRSAPNAEVFEPGRPRSDVCRARSQWTRQNPADPPQDPSGTIDTWRKNNGKKHSLLISDACEWRGTKSSCCAGWNSSVRTTPGLTIFFFALASRAARSDFFARMCVAGGGRGRRRVFAIEGGRSGIGLVTGGAPSVVNG